ncbi:MAG: hypothetical protein Q7S60_00795 [bacterium]|nr:hypothetical protein [bacterium]
MLIGVALIYLPFLQNPSRLFERGNDLQEQFWPVFYFIKQQFLTHHSLPLWNNLFFSGIPLLPDPQFPLFYPPYIIFLVLPIDAAFLVLMALHTLFGGLGAYWAGRYALGLTKSGSIFVGMLFLLTPRLAGYLEAGHFGLIEATSWLPFVFLATVRLVRKPTVVWAILLAVSLAGIFYTHTVTFVIAAIAAPIVWGATFLLYRRENRQVKSIIFFSIGTILTFGLVAITLLPQLEWAPHTTRFLLLQDRDVYPKWLSIEEFLQAVAFPWPILSTLDTEKWLALGLVSPLLALYGLAHLPNKTTKLFLGFVLVTTSLIALNNSSPFYKFLLSQDWYVLSRVATRIWFIPTLILIGLAGYAFDRITKTVGRRTALLVASLAIAEIVILFWSYFISAKPQIPNPAPPGVYEFLKNQEGKFRVFCVNRCLSQKEAVKAGIELVEGYNTLQQMNYYKHSWQLMGGYWNYYTLSLPPIGTYKFEELKPDAKSLGEFNTKYVISPYELIDKNFILEKQFGEYYVYRNSLVQPRAYFWTEDQRPGIAAKIISYSPNKIRVDTSTGATSRLVLAEVWSPGWRAYLDGDKDAVVQEKPNTLRLVDIKPDTKFVDFVYEPNSFKVGRIITLATVGVLVGIGLRKWKRYRRS